MSSTSYFFKSGLKLILFTMGYFWVIFGFISSSFCVLSRFKWESKWIIKFVIVDA